MAFKISAISYKGGVGKTTVVILLADILSRMYEKRKIIIIDADPNQHSADWAAMPGCPANISCQTLKQDDDIVDVIEKADSQCDFVLVDVEGTASMTVAFAISVSNYIIIPCQASRADAKEASKTIKNIETQQKLSRRDIHYAVLFTRTSPVIITRNYKFIRKYFLDKNVPLFETHLDDREAFRALQTYGSSIYGLTTEVSGIKKAQANVVALTNELLLKLSASQEKQSEELSISQAERMT